MGKAWGRQVGAGMEGGRQALGRGTLKGIRLQEV